MPPISPPSDARIARRLRISGRVQGVFYRAWMVETARLLGLGGWVRNRPDGSVEALVAGPEESVRALIARCHEGPPAARVDRLDEAPDDPEEAPSVFEKRPTG